MKRDRNKLEAVKIIAGIILARLPEVDLKIIVDIAMEIYNELEGEK